MLFIMHYNTVYQEYQLIVVPLPMSCPPPPPSSGEALLFIMIYIRPATMKTHYNSLESRNGGLKLCK